MEMTPKELRDTLEQLGFNQSSFARSVGLRRETVSRWVRGEIPVPKLAASYLDLLIKFREKEELK